MLAGPLAGLPARLFVTKAVKLRAMARVKRHYHTTRFGLPIRKASQNRRGEELVPWAWVVERDWRVANDLRAVLDQSGG